MKILKYYKVEKLEDEADVGVCDTSLSSEFLSLDLDSNVEPEHLQIQNAPLEAYKEAYNHQYRDCLFQGQEDSLWKRIMTFSSVLYYQISIREDGFFHINGEVEVHPRTFISTMIQLSEEHDFLTFFEVLKKLNEEIISLSDFHLIHGHENVKQVWKKVRYTLDQHLQENKKYVAAKKEILFNDNRIGHWEVLTTMKDYEEYKLYSTITSVLNNSDEYPKLGTYVAKLMFTKNISEFCSILEFSMKQVQREIVKRQSTGNNANSKDKKILKKEIIDEYIEENLLSLISKWNKLVDEYKLIPRSISSIFSNSFTAINHYDKHGELPDGQILGMEEYFKLAGEFPNSKYGKAYFTQDGEKLFWKFLVPPGCDPNKYNMQCV